MTFARLSNQPTIDLLRAARRRIEKPENWIQKKVAVNAQGALVDPLSPEATSFCMNGAIVASAPNHFAAERAAMAVCVKGLSGRRTVISFNDDPFRRHNEVLAAFDRTIAKLEAA